MNRVTYQPVVPRPRTLHKGAVARFLLSLYTDPASLLAYTALHTFARNVEKRYAIPRRMTIAWLQEQRVYTKQRLAPKHYRQRIDGCLQNEDRRPKNEDPPPFFLSYRPEKPRNAAKHNPRARGTIWPLKDQGLRFVDYPPPPPPQIYKTKTPSEKFRMFAMNVQHARNLHFGNRKHQKDAPA